MLTINEYRKVESLEEAYELNQKKNNKIIAGGVWMKIGDRRIATAIDLSGLGLDQITETDTEFVIGAMTTLREIEKHAGLAAYTDGAIRESVRHIVGVFLARNPNSSVFRIVSFAWAGFGATFGAVMLFSLFWKRTNRNGALAGMIVGGVMVFIWKYLIAPLGGLFGIYELLPAFLCSAAAIVVVSLLTAPPSQEIVDEFESV